MKLQKGTVIFNLGDTSFRRSTLLDDYKILLPILREHNIEFLSWEKNNESQATYYNNVLLKTNLFERNSTEDAAKRGRTLTNALTKPGLINKKRKLGEAANNWIDSISKKPDDLESLLVLSIDNIVFLRQMLKLRVYNSEGDSYFYPFRVALSLCDKYKDIPINHLMTILHSINPIMNNCDLNKIIYDYNKVYVNNISFETYISEQFSTISDWEYTDEELLFFTLKKLDRSMFDTLFQNRKSGETQQMYFDFYISIRDYKEKTSLSNLNKMLDLSKIQRIKKAFGFNSIPFNIPRKAKLSVDEFNEINIGNLLLDESDINIHKQFILSKKSDLISEYSDMTRRLFNLTGVLSFENGLVNLSHPIIISEILKKLDLNNFFSGNELASLYEENINSIFYADLSMIDILKVNLIEVNNIIERILEQYDVSDISKLNYIIENEKEFRFRKMIEKDFSREKLITLLKMFSERNPKKDRDIQKEVSDSATVPTIFEYILGLSWYYLCDSDYSVRKSLNLTLDGNFRPLTHAGGGAGDIIIRNHNSTLMLEATLMDKNVQKRGELEPVIRHATNLAIEDDNKLITIFVADELDNNVINIFKGLKNTELESTSSRKKTIYGLTIFSMTINEIIGLLNENIFHSKIIKVIEDEYELPFEYIKIGWRDNIMEKIFNK